MNKIILLAFVSFVYSQLQDNESSSYLELEEDFLEEDETIKKLHPDFSDWMKTQNISIPQNELKMRQELFLKKDKLIKEHNSKPNQSFKMGHNAFSHLTQKEIEANYLGYKPNWKSV